MQAWCPDAVVPIRHIPQLAYRPAIVTLLVNVTQLDRTVITYSHAFSAIPTRVVVVISLSTGVTRREDEFMLDASGAMTEDGRTLLGALNNADAGTPPCWCVSQ